jgi:hypothetical protein
MLFHEILLKAIDQTGMDKDRGAAEAFLHTRMIPGERRSEGSGELRALSPASERGKLKISLAGLFHQLSDGDWSIWQRNCAALKWLTGDRKGKPPSFVPAVIADTIEKMQPRYSLENGFTLEPVRKDGKSAICREFDAFDDLQTLWQLAFVSLLIPEATRRASFCEGCGVQFKPLKSGRPSRRRLCPRCVVRASRQKETNRLAYNQRQKNLMREKRTNRPAGK